jgi:stage II sporulation protein D
MRILSVDGKMEVVGSSGSLMGTSVVVHSRSGEAAEFTLVVPGKLRRRYRGLLTIRLHSRVLEPVVTMPLETAVASIVEAESPPMAGSEALKAQAIASRSFLIASKTNHRDFDFCDTTHCQFLRSPPAFDSPAAKAARETQEMVLMFRNQNSDEKPLAAMYARSCGGRTRTLTEIGVRSDDSYPYYSVACRYCIRHPEEWHRQLNAQPTRTERERLEWNRVHGWSAMPSLETSTDVPGKLINGRGIGHGLGLCQLGAADMARHGASFPEILRHYYPNTWIAPIIDEKDVEQ